MQSEINPINLKHKGFLVGIIFTLCSLVLTLTYVVPIISVLPGLFFENIASALISNDPYRNVGKLTILFLSVFFIIIIILILFYIRKRSKQDLMLSKSEIIGFMFAIYFFVHPLVFYIYWGLILDFRSDGQLIFMAVDSFPISSFSFVLFGILLDWSSNYVLKNKKLKPD